MSSPAEDRAWESYWHENHGRGCVPDAPGVAAILSDCWGEFARDLPQGCAVIDLGSGAGAVLDKLGAVRRDLDLVGVDSVLALPSTAATNRVRTGVAMEQLPFADACFGAACSQFGFEYGEIERSAAELARVIAPSSPVRLVIHDRGGPVVRQGESRLRALRWAVEQNDFFAIAERLADARSIIRLPTPPSFPQAISEARRTFPAESVAVELLSALHAILVEGEARPQGTTAQIRILHQRARSEITTLCALLRVAQDRAEINQMATRLGAAGIKAAEPVALVEPQRGLAFAWRIDAARE